jgi:hypothetical protein
MLAQSESLKSWFRMYQAEVSADTFSLGLVTLGKDSCNAASVASAANPSRTTSGSKTVPSSQGMNSDRQIV